MKSFAWRSKIIHRICVKPYYETIYLIGVRQLIKENFEILEWKKALICRLD